MNYMFRYYRTGVFALQLFVVLFLSLISWNAYHAYFADSEIWTINLGYHFAEDFKNSWVFTRALFYAPLFMFTRAFPHAEQIFFAARTFMLLGLLIQVIYLKKWAFAQTKSSFLSWLAVALTFVSSFYITQAFRVRSDLFLGTYLIMVTYLLNYGKATFWQSVWTRPAVYLIALFITPKGLFYIPIIVILDKKIRGRFLALGFLCLPVALATIYLLGVLRLGYISDTALNFTNYFESTLRGGDGGVKYLSADSFLYVRRFINENFVFFSFFVLSSLNVLKALRYRKITGAPRVGICSVYVLLLMTLLPDSLPFFICSLIPLMGLGVVVQIQSVFRSVVAKRHSIVLLVFVVGLFAHFISANMVYFNKLQADAITSNYEQMQVVVGFRKYLDAYPTLSYYDVIGTVPERNSIRLFAGPHQRVINEMVRDMVMKEKPDVLLVTAKFTYFGQMFAKFVEENYVPIGNGLYIKGFSSRNIDTTKVDLVSAKNSDLIPYDPEFARFPDARPTMVLASKNEERIVSVPENISDGERLKKISGVPMPTFMPSRNAIELFKFDVEF